MNDKSFVPRAEVNPKERILNDKIWVMTPLTPEEREDIKMQCRSTRDRESVDMWDPKDGKMYYLKKVSGPVCVYDQRLGKNVYNYDSIKLTDALATVIMRRYAKKKKLTPEEYFNMEQHGGYSLDDFRFLAKKTILAAYNRSEAVRIFYDTERDGWLIRMIVESDIDACLAGIVVPDVQIEQTKERKADSRENSN